MISSADANVAIGIALEGIGPHPFPLPLPISPFLIFISFPSHIPIFILRLQALPHLSSRMFVHDPADANRTLALDLLPEVGVGGEVEAADGEDGELEGENQNNDADAGDPPAELGAERVEEAAADEVHRLPHRVRRRDEWVPDEPGDDG